VILRSRDRGCGGRHGGLANDLCDDISFDSITKCEAKCEAPSISVVVEPARPY
jgi:hypothetical protein